jgi:hypothetical protein
MTDPTQVEANPSAKPPDSTLHTICFEFNRFSLSARIDQRNSQPTLRRRMAAAPDLCYRGYLRRAACIPGQPPVVAAAVYEMRRVDTHRRPFSDAPMHAR